jgi:phosphate:Na+ symporter
LTVAVVAEFNIWQFVGGIGLFLFAMSLMESAPIAIAADLGTTTTVLIGSLQGGAGKKRVALAHIIFNFTTALFAFALLAPLLNVVSATGIRDPLFSLVAFHSLFNFLGIVIFLPIMRPFAGFLGRRFAAPTQNESLFVSETSPTISDAAIAAITEETAHIIGRVIYQNMRVFSPALPTPSGQLPMNVPAERGDESQSTYDDLYRHNKVLEGEIVSFALKVQAQKLEADQSGRLIALLAAIRRAMNSAKSLCHDGILRRDLSTEYRCRIESVFSGFRVSARTCSRMVGSNASRILSRYTRRTAKYRLC